MRPHKNFISPKFSRHNHNLFASFWISILEELSRQSATEFSMQPDDKISARDIKSANRLRIDNRLHLNVRKRLKLQISLVRLT
jgi:hypothetical protein